MSLSGTCVRMEWPPQSPDLNPIEQIWDFLDSHLSKVEKTSKDAMWKNLQNTWKLVTPKILKKYIYTMKARCHSVIRAKGYHTKY